MLTNYSPTKNINVAMPMSIYLELQLFKKTEGLTTNLSFLIDAIRGGPSPPVVDVNVLGIDGGPPSKTSVLIQVGECVYRWDGESFKELPEGQALRLIYERSDCE